MKTIRDIAKILHVSASTVSKALSGSADISDETRQLVVDYAKSIGYMPRKYHASDKGTVAVVLGEMDFRSNEQFGYEVVLGFQMAAQNQGFNVDIKTGFEFDDATNAYATFMESNNYQGAFLLGFNNDDLRMAEFATTEYPTVLLDNFIDNPKTASVGTDSFVGIDIAVRHLHSLGHRKIAFLNGEPNSRVSSERKMAYKHAVKAYGLKTDRNLYMDGDYFIDMSEQAVEQFMRAGATAILCASDVIASFVINRLLRNGVQVPQQVSVVGYDDLPVSSYLGITTVAQSRMDLGKIAFTVLNDLLSGVSINKLTLRPKLIVRSSTAAVTQD